MELTTVLANLVPVVASWCVLCSYRSGFKGGGAAVGCPTVVREPARGGRPRGPVQWWLWRCPVLVRSNSVGDVVAVRGVALQ
jgi:hypothetical protein